MEALIIDQSKGYICVSALKYSLVGMQNPQWWFQRAIKELDHLKAKTENDI